MRKLDQAGVSHGTRILSEVGVRHCPRCLLNSGIKRSMLDPATLGACVTQGQIGEECREGEKDECKRGS